jgi:hypothetical protein
MFVYPRQKAGYQWRQFSCASKSVPLILHDFPLLPQGTFPMPTFPWLTMLFVIASDFNSKICFLQSTRQKITLR